MSVLRSSRDFILPRFVFYVLLADPDLENIAERQPYDDHTK